MPMTSAERIPKMPMTSAERGRRFRLKNRNDPAFKAKEKERKARAYQARKLAQREEKKEEEEKIMPS